MTWLVIGLAIVLVLACGQFSHRGPGPNGHLSNTPYGDDEDEPL